MEKSIEHIWKEGFLNENALIAPRVNNLYGQKSRHLIDRFKRMGKRNLYGIVIGAFFLLGLSIIQQVPWAGVAVFAILIYLVWVGRRQARTLDQIDAASGSYQYLKDFDDWLKASKEEYRKIYRFVYPALMVTFMLGMNYAHLPNDYGTIANKLLADPDTTVWFGVPRIIVIMSFGLAVLTALGSDLLFKFDIEVIYGRIIDKLEELLEDMEELRK